MLLEEEVVGVEVRVLGELIEGVLEAGWEVGEALLACPLGLGQGALRAPA